MHGPLASPQTCSPPPPPLPAGPPPPKWPRIAPKSDLQARALLSEDFMIEVGGAGSFCMAHGSLRGPAAAVPAVPAHLPTATFRPAV